MRKTTTTLMMLTNNSTTVGMMPAISGAGRPVHIGQDVLHTQVE